MLRAPFSIPIKHGPHQEASSAGRPLTAGDRQNDKSIEDQVAACRELCTREGFAVVSIFEDRAISGASTVNRPGFQSLMRSGEARLFVLVAEDVHRIARDQADWHAARKRLDFLGVLIHCLSGSVSRIDGSLRALYGRDVSRKPRNTHAPRP